ncbi:DUF1223 domain-containing protein [Aestuariivirga litoralis]|uniref:DUF1223 domain-containing protein n=1 Tax=Aestuariivirga litoralis TaxID=2650924 RepID=UPI0018C54F09|nr:DUF1223 domain-containing protein [Aestuariivirga litoralis]MBG1230817.1 DUF1223 domain-containing protein [Aestuariivirga litoralis]
MEKIYSRRKALQLGLGGVAAGPLFSSMARAAQSPVLVELFTSQGCSDCPPADKLAAQLMKEPGVFVVSMNVDYWDYLGWKDTLGKAEWSRRQETYAKQRGDGEVYTPQMVINGMEHAVGSNRGAVDAAIASARKKAALVPVSLRQNGNEISISVGPGAGKAQVGLLTLTPEVAVKIGRGENAGATVTYHNVARKLDVLGEWDGTAKVFTAGQASGDPGQFIAILQSVETGQVMGCSAFTVS